MTLTDFDYSLYLVSARALLPPGKLFLTALEEAIQGGVTVVQIREKDVGTSEFLKIAAASKSLCDKYNVPLIVNDRVDIALAVKAHGVHLGQTDMPVSIARQLLPPGTIVGVSCNTVGQVRRAVKDGADYVGIGAVWATTTKKLTSPVIGVRGVGAMLDVLAGTNIKAVGIGGIKTSNLLRTLYGSVSLAGVALDGVAVVSEIMASPLPMETAQKMKEVVCGFKNALCSHTAGPRPGLWAKPGPQSIVEGVCNLVQEVRKSGPLIHQITNTVVATQSANVTLALGASPIMATEAQEMQDLATKAGALLINIGTLTSSVRTGMLSAGHFANVNRKPVVFDPVGVGATAFRRDAVKELLDTFQVSVIKGNAGELSTLAGSTEVASKGVDSTGAFDNPISFVRTLANRERSIVVLTGKVDYVSDGDRVVALENGHGLLGQITGSGCILGSAIATYCAAAAAFDDDPPSTEYRLVDGDMFLGAIAGVLVLTIAGERAAKTSTHGSFLATLIDRLWDMTPATICAHAKIEVY